MSEKFDLVIKQASALVKGESDRTANLSNITALLREAFGWFWIGFYLVKDDELVLGPFQGPVACTRIGYGKGVCGTAWKARESILVPDVHQFPGHIACSALSQSEVVVPIFAEDEVVMVLDIDSDVLDDFTQEDQEGLEMIAQLIGQNWTTWS